MLKQSIKIMVKPHVTPISFILGTIIGGIVGCLIGGATFSVLFIYYLKYSGASPGFGFMGGVAIIWVAILNSICGAAVGGAIPVNKWQGAVGGILIAIITSFNGIHKFTLLDISFSIGYLSIFGMSCFVCVWLIRDILRIGVKIEDDFDLEEY
ncbi:MAG: hypothetical protein ABI954_00875 [Pyrinomonadaceae bacterium]